MHTINATKALTAQLKFQIPILVLLLFVGGSNLMAVFVLVKTEIDHGIAGLD